MTTLKRDSFLDRFAGRTIDLNELRGHRLRDRKTTRHIARADRNRDGKISGSSEMSYLFTALDRDDRDGSRHSVTVGTADAPTDLGRLIDTLDAIARPNSAAQNQTPLQLLLEAHPDLETHQDLINHFLRAGQGRWTRAADVASVFGVDLNAIAGDRKAKIDPNATPGRSPVAGDLDQLIRDNPALETHQHLINHFWKTGGRRWAGAQREARRYGLDMNLLAHSRDARLARPTAPPAPEAVAVPVRRPEVATPPETAPDPVLERPVDRTVDRTVDQASGPRVVPRGTLRAVFLENEGDAERMSLQLTRNQRGQTRAFLRIWRANRHRYEAVAEQTGVPAALIAAIHYRESSGSFGTYLHQGDRLGRPAVNVPRNIPVFHRWENAAVHALTMKDGIRRQLGITRDTNRAAALATYAERYNGLGYHKYHRLPSAYVWAGTNIYQGGRYVRDGVFDRNSWDRRPGVMALLAAIDGAPVDDRSVANQTPEQAWEQVLAGNELLRLGISSEAVTHLQSILRGLGFVLTPTGTYDSPTKAAVIALQRRWGLDDDGLVGEITARRLNDAYDAL